MSSRHSRGKPQRGLQPVALTLYVRRGCHLCEDMQQQLHELLPEGSFSIQAIDIDEDPALFEQFNVLVPVLKHGSDEICHHFLDLDAVRRVLASYH